MELKYKPWIGGILFLMGLVNLSLAALTSRTLGIVSGLLILVLGVLMLTRPVVSLSRSKIGMRNLLGMEIRRHDLTAGNYRVENNKIYVNGKKRVSLWSLDADEGAVRNYLAGHDMA